jgi:hypothetical protein
MKFTDKHKKNISIALKGKKKSLTHCLNISKGKKGKPSWNKGKKCSWSKFNLPKHKKGNLALNWKGGEVIVGGYAYVYNKKLGTCFGGKYIKKANLVWYQKTGELIKKPYCLHHKDNNKLNDDFNNLTKMDRYKHIGMEGNKNIRNSLGQFCKKV